MLLQEFQHALHFSACLKTLVFSDMIHELKMSEKIIYIYIYFGKSGRNYLVDLCGRY